MNPLDIETSSKVITGESTLMNIFNELPANARKVVLITGKHFYESKIFELFKQQADSRSLQLNTFVVGPEPTTEVIDAIISDLGKHPDLVIGIGGGSALDAAKAVAVMLTSEGSTEQYLEGVGTLSPLPREIPFYAVPTTSGTGSEATKNAVFIKPGKISAKKSIRHDSYIPDLVILDPLLMLDCPPPITAACGFDAISQLLEAYISVKATEYTDRVCLTGLTHAFEVFPGVCAELSKNTDAREKMAIAAYLGGVGLANAGLVNIHGIAGPIGGEIDIPHGVAVALVLPETLALIIDRLPEQSTTIEKLNKVGHLIKTSNETDGLSGCQRLLAFLKQSRDQHLKNSWSDYSITQENIERIAKESSDKNSPVSLSETDILHLLSAR